MRGLYITLYVVAIILAIYIIILVILGLVVNSVHKLIDRKDHSIKVIMAQKLDLLITLSTYVEENNIVLSDIIKENINEVKGKDLEAIDDEEKMRVKTILFHTSSNVFFTAEDNGLVSNHRYLTLKHSLLEVDELYRKEVAIYNSEVMAYNYWIKFFLFRPVSFVLRLKSRNMLY